VIDLFGGPWH